MSITLKIIRYQGQLGQHGITAVFGRDGGNIGRADDNDLILVDPERYVSRHHATISYENGDYYLTDTSTGGTYIDSNSMPLRGKTMKLEDGSRLTMGEYELLVNLRKAPSEKRGLEPEIRSRQAEKHKHGVLITGSDSVLDFASFNSDRDLLEDMLATDADDCIPEFSLRANSACGGDSLARLNVPVHEHFDPPAAQPADRANFATIPEDINVDDFFNESPQPDSEASLADPGFALAEDRISADIAGPKPAASKKIEPHLSVESIGADQPFADKANDAEERPDSPRDPTASVALSAFFEGAHLKHGEVQDDLEMLRKGGAMLREMTAGIMSILRDRAEFKSQTRMSVTTIRAENNNPLKFSPSAEIALKGLLFDDQPGFLDALKAIEQAFDDVRNHQLALSAGIQAAVSAMTGQIDPERIAQQLEDGPVFNKKAKCWDNYSKQFEQIAADVTDSFFGEKFVQAYEDQMEALQSARDSH